MKALSIRNLPEDVYEALKKMAASNHRSLQEQVRCLGVVTLDAAAVAQHPGQAVLGLSLIHI